MRFLLVFFEFYTRTTKRLFRAAAQRATAALRFLLLPPSLLSESSEEDLVTILKLGGSKVLICKEHQVFIVLVDLVVVVGVGASEDGPELPHPPEIALDGDPKRCEFCIRRSFGRSGWLLLEDHSPLS